MQADLGDWTAADIRVALLGDSTLDNIAWVGGSTLSATDTKSIPEQLAAAVPCAVCNLAADGFKSCDVLHGSRVVISSGIRNARGDPVKWSADGLFRPLEQLASLEPPPTHVVLSIGGNDVREILGDLSRLPEIVVSFSENYRALVEACRGVTRNVVLMWQYRPAFESDRDHYRVYQAIGTLPGPGDAVAKLNGLMESIYRPMLELAQELQLPVVDLPRTFDIHNSDLYSHQIEPSAKGGEVITALLRHVLLGHEAERPSALYLYAPCVPGGGEVVEEANEKGRSWTIAA